MKTTLSKWQPEVGYSEALCVWELNSQVRWHSYFLSVAVWNTHRKPSRRKAENGENHIRQHHMLICIALNGDYSKAERRPFAAMSAMRNAALNISYGNRVPIVVRGRESRPHGEGEQFVFQYKRRKVCETS